MNDERTLRLATLLGLPLDTPGDRVMDAVETALDLARKLMAQMHPTSANSNVALSAAEETVCSRMGLSKNDFVKSRCATQPT